MKIVSKFIILFFFSLAWSSYMVIDYVSLPKFKSENVLENDYRMWLFAPGDGHVSFGEDIVFGICGSTISFLLFMDILKEGFIHGS
jgi:hypothetical protein